MKRFMQDLGDLAGLDIATTRRAQTTAVRPAGARSDEVSAGADAKAASAGDRCRAAVRRVLRDADLARAPVLIRR